MCIRDRLFPQAAVAKEAKTTEADNSNLFNFIVYSPLNVLFSTSCKNLVKDVKNAFGLSVL